MNMHSYKNTARVAQVSQQVRKQMLRAPVLTRTDLGRIPLCTFHSTAGFCSPAGHGQLWGAAAKTYCCFRSVAYIYRHLLSQPEAAAHVSGRGHSRVTQTAKRPAAVQVPTQTNNRSNSADTGTGGGTVPMLTESSQASRVSVTVNTYTYVRCFLSWFCFGGEEERKGRIRNKYL